MTTPTTVFDEEIRQRAREILARYPADRTRSALLPLLHLVQSVEGHVSPAGVEFCAEVLGINKAQVGAVASFYTMYKRRPTGDYLVSVCTNTMCNVLGGQEVYDTVSEHLGVGHDETTADGSITLEHAECLAACDYGPVVTVNYDFFDNVTPGGAVDLVDELRGGQAPAAQPRRPALHAQGDVAAARRLPGQPRRRGRRRRAGRADPARPAPGPAARHRGGRLRPGHPDQEEGRRGLGRHRRRRRGRGCGGQQARPSDAKPAGDAAKPQEGNLRGAKEANK